VSGRRRRRRGSPSRRGILCRCGSAGVGVAAACDAAEFFDVDVDELAWPVAFVADDLLGLFCVQPGAAVAVQDRVHGRGCQAQLPGNVVGALAEPCACLKNEPLDRLGRFGRRAMWPARAVLEPLAAAEASDPFRAGLA
jgi:hypothetical protein